MGILRVLFPILLIAFVIIAVTRPGLLRKIFGVVEPLKTDLSKFRKFDADEAGQICDAPATELERGGAGASRAAASSGHLWAQESLKARCRNRQRLPSIAISTR